MSSRIPNEVIEEIQNRLDIAEVISGYIPLKRSGRNFKALCPFHHEKTASFMVNSQKGIFHCFGCGVGGNVFGFIMKYERLEFPEAVRLLASKANITLPARVASDSEKKSDVVQTYRVNEIATLYFSTMLSTQEATPCQEYLRLRDIRRATMDELRLGFATNRWDGLLKYCRGKGIAAETLEKAGLVLPRQEGGHYDRFRNRVIFPIFDQKDRVVGFGGRVLDDSLPKYVNSPETTIYSKSRFLYGLNIALPEIRDLDQAVVVEGYLDFITPFQHGVRNVVASLGTALTSEQIRLLRRFTHNIVMVYDADQAGEAASLRNLDILLEEGISVKVVNLEKGYDPDSYIRKHGVESFKRKVDRALSLFDYKLRLLTNKFNPHEVEEKVVIVDEMLPTVSKVQNAVLKSEYVRRLAESLALDEEALLIELKKIRKEPYATRFAKERLQPKRMIRPAEKILAGLMLEDKEARRLIMGQLKPEEFHDHGVREIVAKIYDLAREGKNIVPGKLINCLEDEGLAGAVSELAASLEGIINKRKSADDCIKRVKQDDIKMRINLLQSQIQVAQDSGDERKLVSLIAEYKDLMSEYKVWR